MEGNFKWLIYYGAITSDIYLNWLEIDVLPKYTAYSGPRSVLIMDNVSIYKGPVIQELCERFGVVLEYLLPYSLEKPPI